MNEASTGSHLSVLLVEGPLGRSGDWQIHGAGAIVQFDGVVRELEEGRSLAALVYEAYEPMTQKELEVLTNTVAARHGLLGITVEHSVGRVPVGAISFRLRIAAEHRKPALRAMDEFIDTMKDRVPLWKVPEWTQP